jgi:hypothetical protein
VPLERKFALRPVADLARSWRSRSRLRESKRAVRRVREELAGISNSTESMFLSAGERLVDLQKQSREITTEAASFAELLADGGSLAAIDEALAGGATGSFAANLRRFG